MPGHYSDMKPRKSGILRKPKADKPKAEPKADKPKAKKGSKEMKEKMAKLRAMRGKKKK